MEKRNKFLSYLLPFRCIVFLLIFVVGASVVGKKTDAISNWWSVVASIVNIITIWVLFFITKKQGSNY